MGATTLLALLAPAQAEPLAVATPVGPEQVIFDGPRQGCDPIDIPDAPLRAFRLADGRIAAFGLHHENRRLVGTSLATLKIECPVAFAGKGDANPARLDDRIWIAATSSPDGRVVHALGHAEYHGEAHGGRCPYPDTLKCLWVGIIAMRSEDGGAHFARLPAPVAVPGIKAEAELGRHRGFFNPTNIVMKDGAAHFLVAQTGWAGQDFGVCLFRAEDMAAGRWRAWDGKGFTVAYPSPYDAGFAPKGACKPLPPFPLVPGSVVRHRPSGLWLALYPAYAGMKDGRGGTHVQGGFYLAASRDLAQWSAPTLVMPGVLLGENACGQPHVLAYPVLIDEAAQSRNFEDAGDIATLAYTRIAAQGCALRHERQIVTRRVRINVVAGH